MTSTRWSSLAALVLKIREGGTVQRRACYLALGVTVEGERDVLGIWFQETEGAKFWMQVLSELKQRGLADILFCCVDGLKGFPEAIEAIYPNTVVQTCVVHLIRHSLRYVSRHGSRRGAFHSAARHGWSFVLASNLCATAKIRDESDLRAAEVARSALPVVAHRGRAGEC